MASDSSGVDPELLAEKQAELKHESALPPEQQYLSKLARRIRTWGRQSAANPRCVSHVVAEAERSTVIQPRAKRSTEQGEARAETDLISFDEIGKLLGVSKKTLQNAVAEWRKAGYAINDPISYVAIRPLLLARWKAKAALLPEKFADARKILDTRK